MDSGNLTTACMLVLAVLFPAGCTKVDRNANHEAAPPLDPGNRLEAVSLNRVSISNPATLDVSQLVARHGGAEHLEPGARIIREVYDGSEFKTIDVMTITAKKGRSGALLNKRLPDTDIGTCNVKVLRLVGGDSSDTIETTKWYRGRGALEATPSSTLPGSG